MAINFPDNPSVNDTYTEASITWVCTSSSPVIWTIVPTQGVGEAPQDNKQYARINGGWEEVAGGGDFEGTILDASDDGILLETDTKYTWLAKNTSNTFSALLPIATTDAQNDIIPFVVFSMTGKFGEVVELSTNTQGNFWENGDDTGASTYSVSSGDRLVLTKAPVENGQSGGVWQVSNLSKLPESASEWTIPSSGNSFTIGENYILGAGLTGNINILGSASDIGLTSFVYVDVDFTGVTFVNGESVTPGDVLLVVQTTATVRRTINLTASGEANSYQFSQWDGTPSTYGLSQGENLRITQLPTGGLGVTRTLNIPTMSLVNSNIKPIKITCSSNGNSLDVLNLVKPAANTWFDEGDVEITEATIQVRAGMELILVPKGLSSWQVLGYYVNGTKIGGTVTTPIGTFSSLILGDNGAVIPTPVALNPEIVGGLLVGAVIDAAAMTDGTRYTNYKYIGDPVNGYEAKVEGYLRKTNSLYSARQAIDADVPGASCSVECLAQETLSGGEAFWQGKAASNNGVTGVECASTATSLYTQLITDTDNMVGGDNDKHIASRKFVRDQIRNVSSLPVFADDAAAGVGGLQTDDVYKTATGELRIKL